MLVFGLFLGTFLTAKTDDDRFRYNNCSTSDQMEKCKKHIWHCFRHQHITISALNFRISVVETTLMLFVRVLD